MNKMFIPLLIMVFAASALLAAGNATMTSHQTVPVNGQRDDVVYWTEDFEGGQGDWTYVDETAPSENWHLSTEGAYAGNSWWMGDESIGGYTNHRYVVLDPPAITLPAGTPTLTFMMDYAMEDTGGTGNYDAWDGFNVRISTNGGTTWTPISGSPAYNGTSFYSFGYEFNEGENIPGWGGTLGSWTSASFALTSYAGQSVMIRFAFASDPAGCTDDSQGSTDWFGVRLDNIDVAGVFSTNGDGAAGDSQMIPGYEMEVSGDFWEVCDEMAYSGTMSAHCPVEPNILDALVSPLIDIPSLDEVFMGYTVYCDMLDSDGDGDNSLEDYYLVYVKGVDEVSWTRLHYLFNNSGAGGLDSEWTNITQDWALINLSWQDNASGDISDWAGQTVQFKFEVKTDDNDDGGLGAGMFIDDVIVYSSTYLPAPYDVMGNVNDDYEVELNWANPAAGGGEGWIHWDDGINNDSVGSSEATIIDAAARFDADDLLPYVGSAITTISFYPNEASCTYTLKIWDVNSNVLMSQAVSNPSIAAWNEIDLTTPYTIVLGQELKIGYTVNNATGYPCGADAGPMVQDKGGWFRADEENWTQLTNLDCNWNIQAYVTAPAVQRPLRDITGYNVYRSLESGVYATPIATITDPEATTYLDASPDQFALNYYTVTAVYDEGESSASDEIAAFVLAPSAVIQGHDDGTAEDDYAPASGQSMATKFNMFVHPDVNHVTLMFAAVYVESVNDWDAVVKVWDDDGEGGMPGTEVATFLYDNALLTEGAWNYIAIAEEPQFEDGTFYIGFLGVPNAVSIGVDESDTGYSYATTSGVWGSFDGGNFMIQAIVDSGTGIDVPGTLTSHRLSCANYPNPFNPSTTVWVNLPQAGNTTVNIYNVKGQVVKTLASGSMTAGQHTLVWNGEDNAGRPCSSGLYFYRVSTPQGSVTHKMMMLK